MAMIKLRQPQVFGRVVITQLFCMEPSQVKF